MGIREIHELGDETSEWWCPRSVERALLARGMRLAGRSDAGRGYRMVRPNPAYGQIIVCFGGVGQVQAGDGWTDCSEGHAYLSPPFAPSVYKTTANRRWSIAWVQFRPEAWNAAGLPVRRRSVVTAVDPYPVLAAIEGLYREGVGKAERLLMDQWSDLLHRYVCRLGVPGDQHRLDPLRQLWALVDARPAAAWSLDRLATASGMNPETLRVRSKAHVGRSPMRQVTHLRMQRADFLLRSTPTNLTTIARAVGYENVFAFSTAFRRHFGVPPSERRCV